VQIIGLYRYPLKSARGSSLAEASLDPFGIEGDRRWCLLGEDGKVITQRDCPALATIEVQPIDGGIELHSHGGEPIAVPVPKPGAELLSVQVWRDRTEGEAAGVEADAWLSGMLGLRCRLLYMPLSTCRQVSLEYGQPGDRVSFADGYPLLLTSEASLADLNRRLDRALPMDRFRPNLVIDGKVPFAEDDWARIRVGSTEFRVAKSCARCVVTTTDQRTGARGPEPLRTLASFRNVGGSILFGENLIHEGPGPVRLGDPVEVLESRSDAS
jgi:uncharacterized protein YcbX